MLGIKDPWIIMAYVFTLASAVLCIVYGYLNWNKGGENEALEMTEEASWEQDEKKIEENL